MISGYKTNIWKKVTIIYFFQKYCLVFHLNIDLQFSSWFGIQFWNIYILNGHFYEQVFGTAVSMCYHSFHNIKHFFFLIAAVEACNLSDKITTGNFHFQLEITICLGHLSTRGFFCLNEKEIILFLKVNLYFYSTSIQRIDCFYLFVFLFSFKFFKNYFLVVFSLFNKKLIFIVNLLGVIFSFNVDKT